MNLHRRHIDFYFHWVTENQEFFLAPTNFSEILSHRVTAKTVNLVTQQWGCYGTADTSVKETFR